MSSLGYFDLIGQNEIIESILLFCDFTSQINFCMTCKRFRSFPAIENHWKILAEIYWKTTIPRISSDRMREAMKLVPELKPKHFVLHLSKPNQDGPSFRFPDNKHVQIGRFKGSRSLGISLVFSGSDSILYGDWIMGKTGEGIWKREGWTYKGQFNARKMNGQGTITFSNGFTFTCDWKDDVPLEPIIEDRVEQCIRNNICTNSISAVEPFGQIMRFSGWHYQEVSYCQVCVNNGNCLLYTSPSPRDA
eukprot:TRINITY_DN6161_c0_g1_i2.p1 TRINITY_DN6161_c0_g1~~TRINITY_DN6161_c0_g1_i2.p1  ORF type:complete len:248 (-),score=32.72 TRINITY_DN6161_c0_g1_i2:21-764(-)